eukprot:3326174-Prymnesium_polylepis.1
MSPVRSCGSVARSCGVAIGGRRAAMAAPCRSDVRLPFNAPRRFRYDSAGPAALRRSCSSAARSSFAAPHCTACTMQARFRTRRRASCGRCSASSTARGLAPSLSTSCGCTRCCASRSGEGAQSRARARSPRSISFTSHLFRWHVLHDTRASGFGHSAWGGALRAEPLRLTTRTGTSPHDGSWRRRVQRSRDRRARAQVHCESHGPINLVRLP